MVTYFDPVRLSEITRGHVCGDGLRKYYRFRPSRFYGGISTADCVGCCLRCVFCWAWNIVSKPIEHGEFYSPEDVARRLTKIAEKKRLNQMRISGNEPTICWEHLIRVLELIDKKYLFILETNGILIGRNEGYARDLSRFKNLHVRVSLKGSCNEEFSRLTGAVPEGFDLQINALENLMLRGVRVHPACMISFSSQENIKSSRKRLRAIHPAFEDFEVEELILYPHVEERLKRLDITYYSAYRPDNIPPEQV
ncbi:MAG: radical SAM protein [Thermodesulfovibrionales bacterium]